MKKYLAPAAEYVSLAPAEEITITLDETSNPFDVAVALDEQKEEEESAAAQK